jgi:hypothetical protein
MLASLPLILLGAWLPKYWLDDIPQLFGVPIVAIGASAAGTHLAGTMIYILIGYRKVSVAWVFVWFATLTLVIATNRGAMLAVVVPVAIALLMLGRFRLLITTLVVAIGIFTVMLVVESGSGDDSEVKESMNRPVSAHQIVENAKSIVGQSSGRQTEGTKLWRLYWWDIIINDTIHGPNFWTGRGFGINLADADGFAGTNDPRHPRPPLRSPHNAHMTILARAGVPGAVLWAFVLVSWFGMLMRAMLMARARGHERWTELFLFVTCYAMSIMINATFDVTLEGPIQGIWFWCLFGFGIGSVMVYRAQGATEREWQRR